MKFDEKTAIVTGAANGIGRAIAIKLASEGAKVSVVDLDRENVEKVTETIRSAGGTAMPFTVDVTNSSNIKAAVAGVLSEFGQIDILVNSAGGGWKQTHKDFKDTPEGSWHFETRQIQRNIFGTVWDPGGNCCCCCISGFG